MKTNQLKRTIFPLVMATSVTTVGLFASDAPPAEKPVPEESTGEALENSSDESPGKATPIKKKEVDNDLDRQLLRDLLPDLPLELETPEEASDDAKSSSAKPQSQLPFADELDETVAAMREVSSRLDKLNLSDDTEQLQTGIVSNIDELIEKLKNLPPPSSSSSSENSDNDQSDSDSQSQSQGQKKEPQSKPQQSTEKQNGSDANAGATSKPQQGKSAESSEQNRRQARERAAALARRRAMIDEVWGHLPPAMRERLLNVGSEKLLPKYEDLIRRYYEALAEPDNRGARR